MQNGTDILPVSTVFSVENTLMYADTLRHLRCGLALSCGHATSGYACSTNIKKLLSVHTTAARIVLPNVSQLLAIALLFELHWLPVTSRIIFELACLMYKLLTASQLAYLCTLLHSYTHSAVDYSIFPRCSTIFH